MRSMLAPAVFSVFALVGIPLTAAAQTDCETPAKCKQTWVAAQHIGIPLSFFSQVLPPTDANEIRVGDTLVSTLDINVRPRPGNLSKKHGYLPKNTFAIVEDLKVVKRKGKATQIWLRIATDPGAVVAGNAPKGPAVSAGPQPSPIEDPKGQADVKEDKNAATVVGCYSKQVAGNKITTMRKLRDCTGFWVTPKTLVSCSVSPSYCPIIPDNIEGRALVLATLEQYKKMENAPAGVPKGLDDPLPLLPQFLPRMPERSRIDNCRKNNAGDKEGFIKCATASSAEAYRSLTNCFVATNTESEKLKCFVSETNHADLAGLVSCLGGGRPFPNKVAYCSTDEKVRAELSRVRDCVRGAKGGNSARECLISKLPKENQEIAACLDTELGESDPARCLDGLSPDIKKYREIASCYERSADAQKVLACISPHISGDTAKISQCFISHERDRARAALCLLGEQDPKIRAVAQAYKCLKGASNSASLIANCTDGLLDAKSRETISCVAGAGSDRGKLAGCAASAVLPREAARLVGCATSSQSPTQFGLCAAAPAMNEEWRIAADCALQSAGEPVSFATCTAGRLTARELTKCFEGDCFGPDNMIVKGLNNAYKDITQGLGKNNDIVVALGEIKKLAGGENSVINNPRQLLGGENSVINNPNQIFGGDNSVFRKPLGSLGDSLKSIKFF